MLYSTSHDGVKKTNQGGNGFYLTGRPDLCHEDGFVQVNKSSFYNLTILFINLVIACNRFVTSS